MERNYIFNLQGVEIFTIPKFLSDQECDNLCHLIEQNYERSKVVSDETTETINVSRTSSSSFMDQNHPAVVNINNKITKELDISLEKGEPIQGQLYQENQFYHDHCDYFDANFVKKNCQVSGQRTWTVMIYLNDVEEGGNTEFPELGKTFAPDKGTAVVWKNSDGFGREYPATLHSGRPVIKGKKIIITKWFRENEYQPLKDKEYAGDKKFGNVKDVNGDVVPIEVINNVPHLRFKSNNLIPKITIDGFAKRKIPAPLFEKIIHFYNDRRKEAYPEFNPTDKGHLSEYIHSSEVNFPTEMIPLDDPMKTQIFNELEPILKDWSGREIHRTFCYGIRTYHRGAVLKKHTDGFETRIISAILNVDQEVDEPWALQIDDHQGIEHEVFLLPGDMCLYESAILRHGRVKPLNGNYFANLFVHYINIS